MSYQHCQLQNEASPVFIFLFAFSFLVDSESIIKIVSNIKINIGFRTRPTRADLGFARPARNLFSYLTGISSLQRCARRGIYKIAYEKINERGDPRYKAMTALCCRDRQSWSYCLKFITSCVCNLLKIIEYPLFLSSK